VPDLFLHPRSVSFDQHRWYVLIHIIDRFDTHRWFKASADSGETWGDGVYFAEVDANGEEVRRG
jgi:hypothetical protein